MTIAAPVKATPPPACLVGVVVIGRNEGERLRACLTSIDVRRRRTIYVDSGSTDGSVAFAAAVGAEVVLLDETSPFTAARARNAGFNALVAGGRSVDLVQFIDGDCALVEGWLDKATAFLRAHERTAAVCGRRRERHPERTLFNRLCDMEWNTAIGEALECGGDVLIRASAFRDVNGYSADLIAGEEPELCVRLRARGWTIWRIDADMTLHDAAMTRFRQWWRRSKRSGYAFAEVSRRHRGSACGIWRPAVARAVIWGGVIPATIAATALVHPIALVAAACYPLQVFRLALRGGARESASWLRAGFAVLCKFPEAQGVAAFYANLARGRGGKLIEYK